MVGLEWWNETREGHARAMREADEAIGPDWSRCTSCRGRGCGKCRGCGEIPRAFEEWE